MSYNGYENYETWNISLWINNDESFYLSAVGFMKRYNGSSPYKSFIYDIGLGDDKTPDNVLYFSPDIDYEELNEMMNELKED